MPILIAKRIAVHNAEEARLQSAQTEKDKSIYKPLRPSRLEAKRIKL